MSLFDKFRKSKKKQEHHTCPKCREEMHRKTGLTHVFNSYTGVSVEVPDITAMVCDKCGQIYFDWDEAQRIEEYVHTVVDSTPIEVEEKENVN